MPRFPNYPSCHVHQQSLDSASTPEAFASRELELGTGVLTVTDHGTLAACHKIYSLGREKGLTPILGLEGYFRDDDCPILKATGVPKNPEGTYQDHIKYHHITLHFLDQAAYECGVKLLSKADSRAERHGSERKPLFDWAALEQLGSHNVTMTTGCLIGMVQRHIKEHEDFASAEAYYQRLRSIVKPGNFYAEIFPHVCDRNWNAGVFMTFEDGTETKYHDGKWIKTNAGEIQLIDLAAAFKRKDNPHSEVLGVKHYSKWEDCEPKKLKGVEKREGFLVNECRDWAPDGDIQTGLNKAVLYLAEKYGDPVIVGDDSHFAHPEEKIVQDVRLAQSGNWRFATSYHRQSSEESFAYFESKLGMTELQFGSIIDTAREWADRFKGFRFDYKPSLPTKFYEVRYQEQSWYQGPDPDNTLRYTFDLIEKYGRMPLGDARYEDRLRAEIKLLHYNGTLDLLPYFHLAEDVCAFYEGLGLLTGPGRGSAAGLLLAYLLGITHIDPLKYKLSMERFLTEDRIQSGKLPDIDQDLPTRDPLTNPETGWLKKRFGDHYAQISVDTTLKLRMAVKDVARLRYGHVPAKIEELTKKFLLPPQGVNDVDFVLGYDSDEGHHKGSIAPGHSGSDQALQTYAKLYPEDYQIVLKCLGLPRQKGRHACGFVVANCPIPDFIPLTSVGGEVVTQYTAAAVEAVGGVKMDFLTLNSLNDIGDCIKLIQERHGGQLTESRIIAGKRVPGHRIVPRDGDEYDIWDLPEQPEVLADISQGRTETVFQLNTSGAIQWLREFNHTKPDGSEVIDSILGVAAFTALDRKGPLEVFVTNPEDGSRHNALVEYARRARGLEGSPDVLPLFSELLPETYGVLCVAAGSRVRTLRGWVPIEDVATLDRVQTETGDFRPVIKVINNGLRDCVEVRITNGEALTVTPEHKVLTTRGWIKAGELKKTDLVCQFWPNPTPHLRVGDDRDWVVGLMLADADLCAGTPEIACSSQEFAEEVKAIADRAWELDCVVHNEGGSWYCRTRHKAKSGTTPNPLTRYLREHGLVGLKFDTKHFAARPNLSHIAGFYEGDGCTHNNRIRIKNEVLARQIFETLQAAHMDSSLYLDVNGVWTIVVNDQLPLRLKKQNPKLFGGYRPRPLEDLKCIPRREGSDLNHRRTKRPFISKRTLRRLAGKYGFAIDETRPFGKVVSLRPVGPRRVFDLSVADVHSFVVGGSVVHNCYQEQVQKIYQHLTGCSLAEAEGFRGDLAKKKKSKIEKAYALFMERAGAKIGQEKGQAAWDAIQTWSGYGFCLAHAVSYAVIGYACAWLKHHYPLEWWCSVLKNADKNEVSEKFWRHCGKYIDLPDVSLSGESFQIVGNRIQAPINLLHGIGEKAHAQLCRYRPYRDITDFCEKLERYKDETASWKERVKKETDESGQIREVNVTVWERGRSPITRGVVYTMIISGAMDSLFATEESDVLTKLTRFEEELAKAAKKKRPEKIDPKYLNVGPLVRYQMRKAVLPAYAEDLRPVLARLRDDIAFGFHSWTRYDQWGGTEQMETELVGIDDVEALASSRTWSGWISAVAYVVDQRVFTYGSPEKREACELILDIDGVNVKMVHWARKKQRVAEIYRSDLKGALVVTVLSKYKPDRPFSIESISVVQGPLDHSDDAKEPNERTGIPTQADRVLHQNRDPGLPGLPSQEPPRP